MAFETKEQVLERILDQEKPKCPHCSEEMNIWESALMTTAHVTSRAGII
jgi:hypothetical protein